MPLQSFPARERNEAQRLARRIERIQAALRSVDGAKAAELRAELERLRALRLSQAV